MIKLSKTLYDEAKTLGTARHDSNRAAGVPLDFNGDNDPYEMDIEGVAGEMAFAQHVDADESEWEKIRTIKPTSALKGEDYGDCDWNGYSWDIKTTPYNSGHVLVMTSKLMSDKIDGYVLMVGSKGEYECRGCISHARVLKGIREGRYRMKSRNTYWVMQSDLMPLPSKPKPAGFDDYTKDQITKLRKHYDR
jgi:hypothetical protein